MESKRRKPYEADLTDGHWEAVKDLIPPSRPGGRLVREQEAPTNELDPSAAVSDSQTVKSSEYSGQRDHDGGKKIKGRKLHIKAAERVMEQLKVDHQSRWEVISGDNTYHNHTLSRRIDDQRDIDWRLEIVRGRWRRLSRNVERLKSSREAIVKLAAIGQMLRRLDPPIQPPFKYRLAS